jgi:hypothetical protein
MHHEAAWISTMPMAFSRSNPYHVSGADALRLMPLFADPAAAADHMQHLANFMLMPVRARAWRKEDVIDLHTLRERHHRIAPDTTRKRTATHFRTGAILARMHHLHKLLLKKVVEN